MGYSDTEVEQWNTGTVEHWNSAGILQHPEGNIPKVNLPSAIGLAFYHAYLVYAAKNNFYMASNPVPLKLVK